MAQRIVLLLVLLLAGCTPHKLPAGTAPPERTPRPTSTPIRVEPVTVVISTVQPAVPTPLPVAAPVDGDLLGSARSWLGTPYLWGGCSRAGVDCSCFVRNVLATVGINAPRVTYQQIAWATPVSAAEARPFDLVFFDNTCTQCGPNPTHVGMYLGGGMMIDAGDPVRIEPVYGGHNARYGRPPGL